MNRDLLELIRQLSDRDFKSLPEKGLKAAEEVGELAAAILPYVSAHSTMHKFVGREGILDGVADVIICALSVAYSVGATDNEVEAWIENKSLFWAEIQKKVLKISDKLPFEVHITVKTNEIERFREACRTLAVKAVVLDIQNTSGNTITHDVMTSSKFLAATNREAHDQMERVATGLAGMGFLVTRKKIETAPWHPAAPSAEFGGTMPPWCYFESHFNIIVPESRLEELQAEAARLSCHLSRNVLKKLDDGLVQVMMTSRFYDGTREDFATNVALIKSRLAYGGYKMEKEVVEFSLYDSRVSHDAEWLKSLENNGVKPRS